MNLKLPMDLIPNVTSLFFPVFRTLYESTMTCLENEMYLPLLLGVQFIYSFLSQSSFAILHQASFLMNKCKTRRTGLLL